MVTFSDLFWPGGVADLREDLLAKAEVLGWPSRFTVLDEREEVQLIEIGKGEAGWREFLATGDQELLFSVHGSLFPASLLTKAGFDPGPPDKWHENADAPPQGWTHAGRLKRKPRKR
jgi:hypothetical protein